MTKTMAEEKDEALSKFTTKELDTLFISLTDEDSNLRERVKQEIYRRTERLKDAKKEE